MGSKEDLLILFSRFAGQKEQPIPLGLMKDRLSKEHEEMMRYLKTEESISRELTKKSL